MTTDQKPDPEIVVVTSSDKPSLRRYQGIWQRIVKDPTKPVRLKCPSSKIMRKVRKAIWKEKDLDKENRFLWKMKCEFVLNAEGKETGLMVFSLTKAISEDDV